MCVWCVYVCVVCVCVCVQDSFCLWHYESGKMLDSITLPPTVKQIQFRFKIYTDIQTNTKVIAPNEEAGAVRLKKCDKVMKAKLTAGRLRGGSRDAICSRSHGTLGTRLHSRRSLEIVLDTGRAWGACLTSRAI